MIKKYITKRTITLMVLGIFTGILIKCLDEIPINSYPNILQMFDLGNFFSRLGVWLFIALAISLSSGHPINAAVDVFFFLIMMVISYFVYTMTVLGFYPIQYMKIWVLLSICSPVLAYLSWYAKGESILSVLVGSVIIAIFSREVFAVGWVYFDIRYYLEFVLWFALIALLYKTPKQIILLLLIGMSLFLITANIPIINGIL